MKRLNIIFGFFVSIIAIIFIVKILNYIPLLIQKDSMRRYNSIEEVKKRLDIRDIYIPSFFPEEILWPPSVILGQGKPYLAIIMEFKNSKSGETALVICQSASEKFKYDGGIRINNIMDRINYPFKGRNISILTGSCENGNVCTIASWKEEKYIITVTSRFEPPQLLKIVESMIH